MDVVYKITRCNKPYGLMPSSFIFQYPDGTPEVIKSPDRRFLTVEQENEEALATYCQRLKENKQIQSGELAYKPITWVQIFEPKVAL